MREKYRVTDVNKEINESYNKHYPQWTFEDETYTTIDIPENIDDYPIIKEQETDMILVLHRNYLFWGLQYQSGRFMLWDYYNSSLEDRIQRSHHNRNGTKVFKWTSNRNVKLILKHRDMTNYTPTLHELSKGYWKLTLTDDSGYTGEAYIHTNHTNAVNLRNSDEYEAAEIEAEMELIEARVAYPMPY